MKDKLSTNATVGPILSPGESSVYIRNKLPFWRGTDDAVDDDADGDLALTRFLKRSAIGEAAPAAPLPKPID